MTALELRHAHWRRVVQAIRLSAEERAVIERAVAAENDPRLRDRGRVQGARPGDRVTVATFIREAALLAAEILTDSNTPWKREALAYAIATSRIRLPDGELPARLLPQRHTLPAGSLAWRKTLRGRAR